MKVIVLSIPTLRGRGRGTRTRTNYTKDPNDRQSLSNTRGDDKEKREVKVLSTVKQYDDSDGCATLLACE